MALLGTPTIRYYFDEAASGTTPSESVDVISAGSSRRQRQVISG
jgi:hypothetical protein